MTAGAVPPGDTAAPGHGQTAGGSDASTAPDAPAAPDASTAAKAPTASDASALLRPIAELLREVVCEDDAWLDRVDAGTRVDGDLLVESHELAAWSLALRERYGEAIDLVDYVAGLDIDRIIALTVADVAAYVAVRRGGPAPCADAGR